METPSGIQTWLYDNLPIGVAILDRNLSYLYVNSAYAATQGYTPDQLRNRQLTSEQSSWQELIDAMALRARETRRAVEEYAVHLTYPRQPSLARDWDITLLPLFRNDELEGYVLYLNDVTSRQEAAQLSTSESRLRSILEVAVDAILVIDQDGIILQANPATGRIFGYAQEELVGQPVDIIMPAPAQDEHARYMRRYQQTGIARIIGTIREVQGRRKDGQTFPCELSVSESRESARRRIFVGIIRDITERKQAEVALRKLSRAVEQSPNIVMITHIDGQIEYVNPKFTEVTGYTAEEAVGKNPSFLKSGETPREEYKRLWETIRAGGEWRGEFHNRKKSGELYWEAASISPIRNSKGVTINYLAIKEDITERKHLQQELEDARARLEATLNTVPLPLFVVDADGQVSLANDAARDSYGTNTTSEQLLEMTRLHPDTRAPWPVEDWPIMRALREGIEIRDVEQVVEFPDGREVSMLIHAAPVIVEGQIIGAIGVAQDLTQLKAADRAKDLFLALITHELKSPLNTITIWGTMAQEDETVRDEALAIILRNAQAQSRIIDDLLDISRVMYGKIRLEKAPVDAWEIARRTADGLRATIDARELTLTLQPPDGPLPVLADPVRLGQIINNLLMNAVKFTPAGGKITLAGAREGGMARLQVTDTGHGIPPEQLPLIFTRFQQLGRERLSGGLGLGLALVKGLVELHGGSVEAYSAGEDRGSTFIVCLPVMEE